MSYVWDFKVSDENANLRPLWEQESTKFLATP